MNETEDRTAKPSELSALLGEHQLDAVDFCNEQVKTWGESFEDCQVVRFRVDGKVYVATEDPSDGYRSGMGTFCIDDVPMKNVFEPVRVIGRHRTKGSYGDEDDVLELIDVSTGKTVLEVGTTAVDGYYPCFVAAFHPEAMLPNANAAAYMNESARQQAIRCDLERTSSATIAQLQAQIRELESRLAAGEPVAWTLQFPTHASINPPTTFKTEAEANLYADRCAVPDFCAPSQVRPTVVPLYLAQPPAAQVPDELDEWTAILRFGHLSANGKDAAQIWNACRAAMLATHKESKT